MKFLLILWISKLAALAVNLLDKQRGSNYSGKIAVKLMPDFVAHFKKIDYDKVYFITGTNGKSTTTNLMAHTLRSAGKQVASNLEGANMMPGVATALIKNSTLTGKLNREYLVLEVDERSLPHIRKVLPGCHMGITNLQKDQVQRNGDPDFILRKFQNAVGKDMTLYLNNEEPRSCSLDSFVGNAKYFSVAPNARSYQRYLPDTVTMPCPRCGHPIRYRQYNLAGIGEFYCTKCDYRSRENPDALVTEVDFENNSFRLDDREWNVTYNKPFYIYNYAMVILMCRNIGLTDEQINTGFRTFVNPANHDNVFQYHGKEIRYLRAKQENPEALQSQLDVVAADPRKKAVLVGMYKVMDFDPHYAGTFYFFDTDFTPIVESGVERFVAFSSTVCHDIANRMILAGAEPERVTVVDSDDPRDFLAPLDDIQADVVYMITNMKHVKRNTQYIMQGGAEHA